MSNSFLTSGSATSGAVVLGNRLATSLAATSHTEMSSHWTRWLMLFCFLKHASRFHCCLDIIHVLQIYDEKKRLLKLRCKLVRNRRCSAFICLAFWTWFAKSLLWEDWYGCQQARKQLRTPRGAESFLRGAQLLCPIVLSYDQHIL